MVGMRSVSDRINSCVETLPKWRTGRCRIVEFRETHPFRRQFVDRWRFHIGISVTAQIGKRHIIRNKNQQIRRGIRGKSRAGKEDGKKRSHESIG